MLNAICAGNWVSAEGGPGLNKDISTKLADQSCMPDPSAHKVISAAEVCHAAENGQHCTSVAIFNLGRSFAGISETLLAARPAQQAASRGLHYQAYSVLFFPKFEGTQPRPFCILLLETVGHAFHILQLRAVGVFMSLCCPERSATRIGSCLHCLAECIVQSGQTSWLASHCSLLGQYFLNYVLSLCVLFCKRHPENRSSYRQWMQADQDEVILLAEHSRRLGVDLLILVLQSLKSTGYNPAHRSKEHQLGRIESMLLESSTP